MKNFLLYFGNARAGSTWLHGELSKRIDCNFPTQKEINIFQDYDLLPGPTRFDKTLYFETMEDLVNNEQILLTGDITPANSNATKEQLYWFKENTDRFELNVLPVMTLRDPVSQVISTAIMHLNFKEFNSSEELLTWYIKHVITLTPGILPESITQILKVGIPAFPESLLSWEDTVENVTEVFGKMHFNFYETLFTNESMSKLFSYLEIPHTNAVESTAKYLPTLSEQQILELLELNQLKQENYDHEDLVSRLESSFGKELVDSIWSSSDQIDFSRKVFSFGKHPEFSDEEKRQLYDSYPFMRKNYDFAVARFGQEFIDSIWWNPYK
jgi:hypothetical protein